jgi:hypothetical protein
VDNARIRLPFRFVARKKVRLARDALPLARSRLLLNFTGRPNRITGKGLRDCGYLLQRFYKRYYKIQTWDAASSRHTQPKRSQEEDGAPLVTPWVCYSQGGAVSSLRAAALPNAFGVGSRAPRSGRAGARDSEWVIHGLVCSKVVESDFVIGQAASRRVRPNGKSSRGAGGQPGHPGGGATLGLCTASRCAQHGCPRADAEFAMRQAHQRRAGREPFRCRNRNTRRRADTNAIKSISSHLEPCRTLVRKSCRTRGGLVVFGHNTDMRMHGGDVPENHQAPPLRGRDAKQIGGGLNRHPIARNRLVAATFST